MSVNKAILVGNLGADAELRSTGGEQSVLKWRMATTRKWEGKDGEKKEDTQWHSCSLWGKHKRIEALARHLTKGTTLYVEGWIEHRKYKDKDGAERYFTEINANSIEFVGARRDGDGGQRDQRPAARPAQRPAARPQPAAEPEGDPFGSSGVVGNDDDIPF